MTETIKTSFFTKDKTFYKSFFGVLIYIVLQSLISCAVNMADNIMLGAYSETALSGTSLANQIQFLFTMIVGGVSEGVMVLASQYWGAKNLRPIKRVFAIGALFGLVTGILFFAAVMLFPSELLRFYNDDPEIIAAGVEYIRVVGYTYLFFGLTQVFVSGMRGIENARIGMIITALALITNVGLNYLLIFGKFGFPRLGIKGAAIATLISRIVEITLIALYVFRKEKELKLVPRDFLIFDKTLFKDYLKVSYPLILSGLSWGLAMCIQAMILGHMGGAAIAANSIASALFGVASVVAYGGGSAASIVTGKAVGKGDLSKLREYVRTMQVIFLVIGVCSGLMLYFSRNLVLNFYNISEEASDLSLKFMTVLSLTLMGTAYQVACLTGIVRGGGNTKFVFYNDLVFMWLIVLPLSALCAFVFKLPPEIVYLALKCDQILKCFVALVEVNSYRWVRSLTRKETDVPAASEAAN